MPSPSHEIWVAGYPSLVGGADTELDHLIDLWRLHGVGVHLVPMVDPHPSLRALCDRRGCVTHEYRDDVFAGRLVISLCNGEFLKRLEAVCEAGRPRAVLWANCMTFPFQKELDLHEKGLIDLFLFQSAYQRRNLLPHLQARREVRELRDYRPFFNLRNEAQSLRCIVRSPLTHFGIGRVSRDDGAKYAPDTWKTMAKVCAPLPVKCLILGFGDNARERCGAQPTCDWLDFQALPPNTIPVAEFFRQIHVLIHRTGGSRENWPRVVLEAWAAGVPVIVDDDYGVAEMVTDGVDGFRVRSSDEASFRASQLAFDEPRRRRMAEAGFQTLLREHANPERCMQPFWNLFATHR